MRLHYLVKLQFRVFGDNFNAGKSETQEILLTTLDFTYLKRCNFLILTSRFGKFNQENTLKTLSQSASFRKRHGKNIWVCFRFTVLTAVHLQNANAKFHKVGYRYYLGDTENIYIFVRQIYSGQYVSNVITIGQVL